MRQQGLDIRAHRNGKWTAEVIVVDEYLLYHALKKARRDRAVDVIIEDGEYCEGVCPVADGWRDCAADTRVVMKVEIL